MSRRPARRRPTRVLAWCAALVLAASACTGGDGDGADASPGAGGGVENPGEIVVASGRDVTGKGGIRQQLIDAWNTLQAAAGSPYTARLVELSGSADQQRSQLLGALQSGSAAYDVVNLDVTWVPEFARAGLIRELDTSMVPDDVIDAVAGTARWDDKVYSVPFNSDVGLLYYRRDYLEKAGVEDTDLSDGTTWNHVRELINTLTETGADALGGAYKKGWTTQLGAYEGLTVNGIEAYASTDPKGKHPLTDDQGRYTGSADRLRAGITELKDRTAEAYTLSRGEKYDEDQSLTDFANGKTAFLRHWPYAYRTLHQSLTSRQLGVAPLPGKAVLGGQNLAVTASSGRADAASKLIRYLTDPESERCLLDAGFAATRTSAYTEPGLTCKITPSAAPSPSPSGESTDRMPRSPDGRPAYARRTLLQALQQAVQRPRTPSYGAFTQTFTAELRNLFDDKAPPSDDALATALDRALRDALPDG